MSIDRRETLFTLVDDTITDAEERMVISMGRDLSANLLDRIEAIELYVCELFNVIEAHEAHGVNTQKLVNAEMPVEFLKWDLLNLVEESRFDAVRLKVMLKKMAGTSSKNVNHFH